MLRENLKNFNFTSLSELESYENINVYLTANIVKLKLFLKVFFSFALNIKKIIKS